MFQAPKGVLDAPIGFDRHPMGEDVWASRPIRAAQGVTTVCFLRLCFGSQTGSPRRDLPPTFGNWNTVFKRYRDWVKAGVFKRIFDVVSDDPDMEFAMVDATIVKVHRHAEEQKGDQKSGDREVEGRLDHQNPRADRRAWELGAVRPAPRPSL